MTLLTLKNLIIHFIFFKMTGTNNRYIFSLCCFGKMSLNHQLKVSEPLACDNADRKSVSQNVLTTTAASLHVDIKDIVSKCNRNPQWDCYLNS